MKQILTFLLMTVLASTNSITAQTKGLDLSKIRAVEHQLEDV